MKLAIAAASGAALLATLPCAGSSREITQTATNAAGSITLSGERASPVIVDAKDYPVVTLAANLFADDVKRVTGKRPEVGGTAAAAPDVVLAGTLGHSAIIDKLVAQGRLKRIGEIRGRWEATLTQVVDHPTPGVGRALVIVGSDRRGTAYGLVQLSAKIGVSPWYWWADVPVAHRDALVVSIPAAEIDSPGVKYRGIFINDEDWGFAPWAKKTLDPEFGQVGSKTYAKVFELMLRLRLNYIWPAMHNCSQAFGSVPENVTLADNYAIVAGASHCEPMLYNNVSWSARDKGDWNYGTNRDTIHQIWADTSKARGNAEAVWTLGIRGIHDSPMKGPKDMPGRIGLVSQAITDERALLDQNVTKQWGPIAQCFVPYKEVQPIYDAGLEVPPDVTLVWADDNFGYLRRLSSPTERKRPGGSGFYYHLSYYGTPHSYTWINTTPPALMWEEMRKAWQNQARTIWMVNVGDIKPMEIGIDYLAKLAWSPEGDAANTQPSFLRSFAAENFGQAAAQSTADLLGDYYRLGTVRKPELMSRAWALSLSKEQADALRASYRGLLEKESALSQTIPPQGQDAYTEMVGYPARMLASAGLVFLADRDVQLGQDAAAKQAEVDQLHANIDKATAHYNQEIAGGKWNLIMSGPVTAAKSTNWSSLVRWPWYEKPPTPPASPQTASLQTAAPPVQPPDGQSWRDAAACSRKSGQARAEWASIPGLGQSGKAMALEPATLETSWNPDTDGSRAPVLEYDFQAKGGEGDAYLDFLPTFRIYPGMKLRVSVQVDNGPVTTCEVPGSSGTEDENGAVRRLAVQANYTRLIVPLPGLGSGAHTFKVRAVDPGVVLDRLSLP